MLNKEQPEQEVRDHAVVIPAASNSPDAASVLPRRFYLCMDRIEMRIICTRFPRFVIVKAELYWTGRGWSPDLRQALVYAHADLLREDIRRLKSGNRQ